MTSTRTYRFGQTLGRGGFGTVYKGHMVGQGGFSKTVAIKVLHAGVAAHDDVAQRLRDEARILGLLNHRAIVRVDDLVQLDGQWAVVMEYVEGADLAMLISRSPPPPGPALQIIQEVASALHAAWSQPGPDGAPLHFLHRDIKPSNIRITASGEVKILDFGIARADFSGREAETRSIRFGSLPYMAPERLDLIEGRDTHASDIYTLGVTLFEALAGKRFGNASLDRNKHEQRIETAIHTIRQAFDSPELESLLGDLLAYDAEQRPTAKELARRARRLARLFPTDVADWAETAVRLASEVPPDSPDDLTGSVVEASHTTFERTPGFKPPPPRREPIPAAVPATAAEPSHHSPSTPDQESQWAAGAAPETAVDTTADYDSLQRTGTAMVWGALAPLLGCGIPVVLLAASVLALVVWQAQSPPRDTMTDDAAPDLVESEAPVPAPRAVGTSTLPKAEQPDAEPTAPPLKPARHAPRTPPPERRPATPDEPEDPLAGHVTVTGDAKSVRLTLNGHTYDPGPVEPGYYRVKVDFGDGNGWRDSKRVSVAARERITLRCVRMKGQCETVLTAR